MQALTLYHASTWNTHTNCVLRMFWNTEVVAIMMETSRKLWHFSTFQQFKDHNYVTVIHQCFLNSFLLSEAQALNFTQTHWMWAHDASSSIRYKWKICLITVYNHSNRQLKTRCYSEINTLTVRHTHTHDKRRHHICTIIESEYINNNGISICNACTWINYARLVFLMRTFTVLDFFPEILSAGKMLAKMVGEHQREKRTKRIDMLIAHSWQRLGNGLQFGGNASILYGFFHSFTILHSS